MNCESVAVVLGFGIVRKQALIDSISIITLFVTIILSCCRLFESFEIILVAVCRQFVSIVLV